MRKYRIIDPELDPVLMPLPLPPRPSTAIGGGFSSRFQEHWFDGRSFLLGVLLTTPLILFFGIVLIAVIVGG